jgi:hypothetical protein
MTLLDVFFSTVTVVSVCFKKGLGFSTVETGRPRGHDNVNRLVSAAVESYGKEDSVLAWKVDKNLIGLIFIDTTERRKAEKALKASE